jgi:DNA adenine methylase
MPYPGGKAGAGVYQRLICMIPPHRVYVEPFLGGGAVMKHKLPAAESHGIDKSEAALVVFPPISGLRLHHGDALAWLRAFAWQGDELVYAGPPYPMATKSAERSLYDHELTDAEHAELLEILLDLPCMVMVSSYWSELYADALGAWRLEIFPAMTRGGRLAVEHVWLNFPEPFELHDYRFLGCNFRERQRIKRKQERWRRRLEEMPAHERYAMLGVLRDLA